MKASDLTDWHNVVSTNVRRLRFDTPKGELWVQFNGSEKIFIYAAVAISTFEAFCKAESPGRFHQANIKGAYEHRAIGEDDEVEEAEERSTSGLEQPADPVKWAIYRCIETAERMTDGAIDRDTALKQFGKTIEQARKWFTEDLERHPGETV